MKPRTRGVWFGCLSVVLALAGGSAQAEPLTEALALAYQSNPTVLAERAALRAIDEGVPTALSGWRPTVRITGSAGITYSASKAEGASSASKQTNKPLAAGIELSQPVYRGGATTAETNAAESIVMAGRARLIAVEQEVLVAAATAYLDVVRDQSVVQLNTNNEQVLGRQLQATRDRFEVGEVTRTDVSQAEARLADAQSVRVGAEGTLEASRARYRAVIGVPATGLGFEGFQWSPDVPTNRQDLSKMALSRNPAIVEAGFLERASLYDISVAAAALLPQVSIEGQVARQFDPNTFFERQDSASIRAVLSVPLYQSGSEYARVRQLRQVSAQRRRELDQQRRTVDEGVSRVWEELAAVRAQIVSLETSVRANRIALEGVRQEASVGARTVLDELDAEQELFNAQVNLVQARRDEAVATFELLQVAGMMTAASLGLSVDQYDPQVHYDEVRDKLWGFGNDYQGGAFDGGLGLEGLF